MYRLMVLIYISKGITLTYGLCENEVITTSFPRSHAHIKGITTFSYLCTKNETLAQLYVATLTVKRELPKYEIIFSI